MNSPRLTVRLPDYVITLLRKHAKRTDCTPSDLIRNAVIQHLAESEVGSDAAPVPVHI